MKKIAPLQVTTPGDREVVIVRSFDAPRRLVFDAFTKPALVQRWLLGPPGWTMPVCEIDLRVGGAYHYVWRGEQGGTFGFHGVFREIAAPESTVHTEQTDEPPSGDPAMVTTAFAEDGGTTTVTMTVAYPSGEVRQAVLATGMADGVEQSYERLDQMLAAGEVA